MKIQNLNSRQREIIDHAREQGEVQVESLASLFQVTPQTIRRDLNLLCELHLLQRFHGGAIAHDGVSNLGYEARRRLASDEKVAIGKCAAQLIPDDSSLFINIGTTTEQVAHHLTAHSGLLVISNNSNVIYMLRGQPSIQLMTTGGIVRPEDGGIVGDSTVDFIHQFKVDYAIIGASAIEADGTILDYDPREVRVAQAIIANARKVILVADAMKFERNAPMRIASLAEIDIVVTDQRPGTAFRQQCLDQQVELIVTQDDDCDAPPREPGDTDGD